MLRALVPSLGTHSRGVYTSRYPLGATTLLPALRAGRAFRRDPLAFLLQLDHTAPVFRFKVGFSEYALVNDPELIRRVLLDENERFGEGKWTQRAHYVIGDCLITREGAPHLERRALLQSAFARSRIVAAAPAMVASAQRLDGRWSDGEILELQPEMAHATLTASSEALFGKALEGDVDEISKALAVTLRSISSLPLPRPRLAAARSLLRRTALPLSHGRLGETLRQAGASERQVIDEIVALLIASVETTSATLSWLWCEVGRRPDVETRLHRELAETLGGRVPSVEDVPRLPYLRRVLRETLRLHPPVHFIDRRALEEVELGATTLRRGEYVLLSPLLTQRDPRFHDQATRFLPERWEREQTDPSRRFAYFPFGAGPHVCIGRSLAEHEITLIVALLAHRWRLRPVTAADPGLYASGLRVRLERRT